MSSFAASNIADRAEQLLAPKVREAGYELLMCVWSGRGSRPELWVYIERADGPINGRQRERVAAVNAHCDSNIWRSY